MKERGRNEGTGQLRCLVIEDDADASRYMCDGLTAAGYDVLACYSGMDGLNCATNEPWDVVILDRLLPGGVDGLSILRRLRDLNKPTPVVIVSALTNIDDRVLCLRNGGDDYISKPFALPELLARVEALLRRAHSTRPVAQLKVANLTLDLRTFRVIRGSTEIRLQRREFRLLEYLMRNEGQVVTRAMLLEAVWDCRFDPPTNVIDVQINRLRNKIDRNFSPALIHTVRGAGYLLSASG